MDHVGVDRHDRVAVVTLVDRERRNAMTADDGRRDRRDLRRARGRRRRRRGRGHRRAARVLLGRRRRGLGSLSAQRDDGERRSVGSIYEGFLRVLRSPLPTVAAVNGPAVGAGLNLALACDVRLAGASARFDTRFLRIGLHPGGGHAWMLDRAVGPQAAAAMVLFGDADRRAAGRRDRPRVGVPSRRRAARAGDRVRGRRGRGAQARSARRAGATLREAPWQPDFDAAVATEIDPPVVVARPGLVSPPIGDIIHCIPFQREDPGALRRGAAGYGQVSLPDVPDRCSTATSNGARRAARRCASAGSRSCSARAHASRPRPLFPFERDMRFGSGCPGAPERRGATATPAATDTGTGRTCACVFRRGRVRSRDHVVVASRNPRSAPRVRSRPQVPWSSRGSSPSPHQNPELVIEPAATAAARATIEPAPEPEIETGAHARDAGGRAGSAGCRLVRRRTPRVAGRLPARALGTGAHRSR